MLMAELESLIRRNLARASRLPAGLHFSFDRTTLDSPSTGNPLRVQKTLNRAVRSLHLPLFYSTETVRFEMQEGRQQVHRSPQLADVVPSGQHYAFDLITYVGVEHFLRGRKLTEIAEEVRDPDSKKEIPFTSLYELSRKFLYYLGELHRQSASILRSHFQTEGSAVWLLDGTLEPGTAVFFAVKEARTGILLHCTKIPSENVDDISRCLRDAARLFGTPKRIRHDLSENISTACEKTLPGVPHDVCYYHLLADIGEDLYRAAQNALAKRLRALKLQLRMKDQRSNQTQWLRQNIEDPERELDLENQIRGHHAAHITEDSILGREVLLAIHSWILDYPSDGNRQGPSFDPYLLYLHRRISKACAALDRILDDPGIRDKAFKPLINFHKNLARYLDDPEVRRAAELYEAAHLIFERLRQILRLHPNDTSPLSDSYDLDPHEVKQVQQVLKEYRKELETLASSHPDHHIRQLNQIVLDHLDRYQYSLFRQHDPNEKNIERTTNDLEQDWRGAKRKRRETHGRSKLTLDFRALPEEYMLVNNLENPLYRTLVLGEKTSLAEGLARAAKEAGPFNRWLRATRPKLIGRLPTKLIRQEEFINNLIDIYEKHTRNQMQESAHTR